MMRSYKTDFPDDYNAIMEILYMNNVPNSATLLNNIAVYKKQVQKFLKKAADVIIDIETVEDKKRKEEEQKKQERLKNAIKRY